MKRTPALAATCTRSLLAACMCLSKHHCEEIVVGLACTWFVRFVESPSTRIQAGLQTVTACRKAFKPSSYWKPWPLHEQQKQPCYRIGVPEYLSFASLSGASFSSWSQRQSSVSSWSVIPSERRIFLTELCRWAEFGVLLCKGPLPPLGDKTNTHFGSARADAKEDRQDQTRQRQIAITVQFLLRPNVETTAFFSGNLGGLHAGTSNGVPLDITSSCSVSSLVQD